MAKTQQQLFVAVVEDDAGLRDATESLLNAAGFTVRAYSTAQEFLRSKPAHRAGCLILDVRLPGMSGLELQQQLRELGVGIPIVFITAEADPDGQMRAQALRAGALAFLDKPFRDGDLLPAVQAAFEQHS
jgi:FixJ family two-component response regulator